MITALVWSPVGAGLGTRSLALTLSSLVAGVADGLVGDAVVLVPAPDADAARVADAVGAELRVVGAGGPWRGGAALARRDWLLCLQGGDVLAAGWIGVVERFVAFGSAERPFARLTRAPESVGDWLNRLAEGRLGARAVRPGDLLRKDHLLSTRLGRPVPLPARIERTGKAP